jgi:hypothetical protein
VIPAHFLGVAAYINNFGPSQVPLGLPTLGNKLNFSCQMFGANSSSVSTCSSIPEK